MNDLNADDQFHSNWFDFTVNEYMPHIHLWACRLNERYEYSTLLESQIQRSIRQNYTIGSHINKKDMSWLGKIEHLEDECYTYKFEFTTYPDIDENTTKLLSCLKEKKVLTYKKQIQPPKKEKEQSTIIRSKLRKIRKEYPHAYYRWDPIEEKILLFLLDQKVTLIEMVYHLKRTPEEIERKINTLPK